jgi:hypothetical protein
MWLGEAPLKKASEYRQHAEECRLLAAKMDLGEQREQLLGMARHWDQLAADRTALVRGHPGLALAGERAEERRAASRPN